MCILLEIYILFPLKINYNNIYIYIVKRYTFARIHLAEINLSLLSFNSVIMKCYEK